MNIVIESHVPYIAGVLEPWAKVTYAPVITPELARYAQALIVRTRTRCDSRLLEGSEVRWIGTATIGTDHIDLDYCHNHGIEVVNAPGCNAPAVAQWVMATIGQWMALKAQNTTPQELTIGVVGVGHVGSIVSRWARQLGFNVLECDPPRARNEGEGNFVDIATIARHSDIITFHTPLNLNGEDCTYHLCDSVLLAQADNAKLIINAARGAVCDSKALLDWHGDIALDCWENEPNLNRSLLEKAFVATPHIAGYSLQGKQRGTAMIIEALNHRHGWNATAPHPTLPAQGVDNITMKAILDSYQPLDDIAMLKNALHNEQDIAHTFETLRNNYHLRNEVDSCKNHYKTR